MKTAFACLFVLLIACVALANSHRIHAWEKQAGYPYGRMCNSIFTAYVDTCRQ